MESFEVVKCKDGKAVEHWSFMSMDDVMEMMPKPSMDNKMGGKMDSTATKDSARKM
jgi:hypothetical protein